MSSEMRNFDPNESAARSWADLRPAPQGISHSPLAFIVGFFFSCRTVFVLITGRWLNVGTESGVLAGFAIAAALGLIVMLGTFGPREHFRWFSRPMQWVILYLAFAGCSFSWTASVSAASSALYWLSLVCDVSLVVLLVRGWGSGQVLDSLLKGFIAGSCALAIMAWMMPAAPDLRLGDPDYFNTNQIGNLCALSVLMCSLLAARGNSVWLGIPWFLGVTLLRSLSKSTLAAFGVCLLYRLIRDRSFRRGKTWLLGLAAVVVMLAFWSLYSAYYGAYTTEGSQAETLTGRTGIWAWTLDAALKQPWFGNGFDAMWKVAPPFGGDLFEARHAENELLQQFFAYGACGIVLLVGIYGSLYRRIRLLPRGQERIALTAFLIYVGIRGLVEAEPFDLLLPLWFVAALALLLLESAQPQSALQSETAPSSGISAASAC